MSLFSEAKDQWYLVLLWQGFRYRSQPMCNTGHRSFALSVILESDETCKWGFQPLQRDYLGIKNIRETKSAAYNIAK